jgi:hypothetical protein
VIKTLIIDNYNPIGKLMMENRVTAGRP